MKNFPSPTGKDFFMMACLSAYFLFKSSSSYRRRELIDGNISNIVDLHTFECLWPDQLVLSYADRLSDSAPSDIVFFDDCRADSEPIEELFYRWKADISGKSFLVSQSLVTSICSSQLP